MSQAFFGIKKTFVGVAAIATLIGTPVLAADMPVKASPPPILGWSGFYVGAQVGAAWFRDKLTEASPFVPPQTGNATTNSTAFIGGGHIGYNWQRGNFVFGPEADIEGTSLKKTETCLFEDFGAGNAAPGSCFPQTYSFSTQIRWQASVRGRLGYAWKNMLLYATGGVAFADIKTTYAQPGFSDAFTQTRTGYTVGGGLEYAFNSHWIARLEYRYSDFGTVSNTSTAAAGAFWNGYSNDHDITEHAVRIGLSYRFEGPLLPH